MFRIKRVYEKVAPSDGYRILVDRLWPRGVSKERAKVDLWLKDIGPSNTLRKWFGHDVSRWDEFVKRYREELREKQEMVASVKKLGIRHKTVTLLFGAKDIVHNQAVVLLSLLQ